MKDYRFLATLFTDATTASCISSNVEGWSIASREAHLFISEPSAWLPSHWLKAASKEAEQALKANAVTRTAYERLKRLLTELHALNFQPSRIALNSENGFHVYFASRGRMCWVAVYGNGDLIACQLSSEQEPSAAVVGGGDQDLKTKLNEFRAFLAEPVSQATPSQWSETATRIRAWGALVPSGSDG
jgi:hypothetical protein